MTVKARQDSSFSEEKEAKKLLLPGVHAPGTKVFWFFFAKKNRFHSSHGVRA
jgi:hypothetical protein